LITKIKQVAKHKNQKDEFKPTKKFNTSCFEKQRLLKFSVKSDKIKATRKGRFKCFHNGIILIVNCFQIVRSKLKDKNQ
jgi:hypothetical protein